MQSNRAPENRGFKVTLLVLLGVAAFSSAMKDLNQLREFVSSAQEFTDNWRTNDGLLAFNQGAVSENEDSCPIYQKQLADTLVESDSSNQVELLDTIKVEGIGDDGIEPEVGGEAEVAATRMAIHNLSRLTDQRSARVLKGGAFARSNGRWQDLVELKKLDKEITLDIPMIVLSETKADSFNAGRVPAFPASLLDKISRKQMDVKTHNGKREWILRRVDGNFNVRRSS